MAESENAGREVRDYYGRRYYLRDKPEDRAGRESAVWLAWPPMAAVGVLQYGFGAAVPALMDRYGWTLIGTFSVLAAWAVCQAGVAFPAAWLRERNRISPRTLMLLGAVLCAIGVASLAHGPGLFGAGVGLRPAGGRRPRPVLLPLQHLGGQVVPGSGRRKSQLGTRRVR